MMATTAKYVRLSSEDDDLRQGGKLESNSIANQRDLLDAFISRMPELAGTNIIEFCDDGWSGKNFERPAVQEMIAQARAGKIQCIVVKDLSRFGRDYLTVREFVEQRETKFAAYDDAITRKFVEQVTVLDAETIRIKFRYPGPEVDKKLN